MIPLSVLSVAFTFYALLPKSEAAFPKETEDCYALNRHPYFGFGSKGPYEEVYNKGGIAPLEECEPVQIWMVIRHGTRYPSEDDIPDFDVARKLQEQVLENHKNKKGSLCEEDLASLRNYNVMLDPNMGYYLAPQGQKDLYNIGQRMRKYFPEIFHGSTYTHEQFQFRFTPTPRTKESAEYFFRGVFGLSFHADAHPLPEPLNDLIKIYNACPSWRAAEAKNKVHRARFNKGEHMKKVIESVSRRLGFEEGLSFENMKIIYNGCRFYKAWHLDETSPWCAAFTKDELLALEYEEDLHYYYKSGPGDPINVRLSCPLIKNMYDHFSDKAANIKGKQTPKALFYFSHDILINQLATGLGLWDESDPITENNYLQKANRNFRTTNYLPFAANTLAVLYKCKNGRSKKRPYKVRFFQNEHAVQYPGCSNGICEWEYIEKKFDHYVNNPICTDKSFCTEESTKIKSNEDISIQPVKDNLTVKARYLNPWIIAILSLLIVVPIAVFGIRLLS